MRKSVRKERITEIEEAALSLFSEKGFVETSLDEIAHKVGLTKPSLYLYFKNKNDLFFKMIQSRILKIIENMNQLVSGKDDFITKIRTFIFYYISHFLENRAFFKLIHKLRSEMVNNNKNPMQKMTPKYKIFLNSVSKIMEQGIKEKVLRNNEPAFLSSALIGILNQSLLQAFILTDSSDKSSEEDKTKIVTELTDKILNLFLNGAGRSK